MGLFDWLFRRKREPEPQVPVDMWSPEGMDRLANEELQQAIEAVQAAPTADNRRQLFKLLLTIAYCVPTTGSSQEGKQTIRATQNAAGEPVLVAFTDPFALRRWDCPPSFLVMTAAKFFEFVLDNNFTQVLINPSGPAGGHLSRAEVERMAKGEVPVD